MKAFKELLVEKLKINKHNPISDYGYIDSLEPGSREKAEEIFIKTRNDYNGNYLKQKFTDNSFYHPQYLMSYGKNRQRRIYAYC